ncbi:MAG TPA: hypothetical protein VGM28_07400 [Candidatus Limnocylindrales bacterium]
MLPLVIVLAGLALLAIGWILLRSIGDKARVGRILAATPVVPISRALEIARSGQARYVTISGRIDAEEEFEDEHHRPLVFRRTRLEVRKGKEWTAIEDTRQTVAFEIVEGLDRIAIDGDALNVGLVAVTRESEGTAADVPDLVPDDLPGDTPVRLQIEQLSSVDHAIACGTPVADGAGGAILRPGLRRPLIVSTLEAPEAMRLLAVDHRGTTRAVAVLMAAGLLVTAAGLVWWVVDAIA